jgi:hypothetical protein
MADHMGKTAYAVMGLQTTEGTAAATPSIGLPITDALGLKGNPTRKVLQEYRKTNAEATDFVVTGISADGNINVPAYNGGPFEHLLYGVMGTKAAPTHTANHYIHNFTVGNTLPNFTVYKGYDDLNVEAFKDLQIGSLQITMAQDAEVQLSASPMGTPIGIALEDVTPSYTTSRCFSWTDFAVSLGGSANCNVTAVDVTIDRGLKSIRTACATGGLTDNKRYVTTTKLTGNIELLFQDYTEYKYWLGKSDATTYDPSANVANSKRALVLSMNGQVIDTAPTVYDNFTMNIPAGVYNAADISTPYDDLMKVKFGFDGYWDGTQTAGSEVLSASITSLLPAITGS